MSAQRVIGVDVGGTKILAGLVGRDGQVHDRREYLTPTTSQEDLLEGLFSAVEDVFEDGVVGLGFGVPSRIDHERGTTGGSVNVPLHDLPLLERMVERFGLPVAVENDASVAALAEWRVGAGRGSQSLVMLTLGTGVGGGIVLGGQLYRGWSELGHMVVELDGKPCQGTCTGRGHLESYCSGLAANDEAHRVFGPGADAHRLIRLAREGEAVAIAVLAQVGRRLGAGIGSLVNVFNPEAVVIGGGFGVAAFEFLLPSAREVVIREALGGAGRTVKIVQGELGTAAGLIGAGFLAFEALAD
jgi:glucokinase